ncbi:endo-1,4-beta-xylanase [Streptosporangium soli]|nr:endo-1,4-beta-xylanase [Streptosporangium sp. KLBMP 9127]
MRTLRLWAAALLLCVAPVVAPAQANAVQIEKHDFEDGTAHGWGPRGDGVSVTVTGAAAHTGTRALLVDGRTATWHGASVDALPFLDVGVTYTVTAHARLVSGQPSSTVALTAQRTPDGGTTAYERVAAGTVTDAAWVELSGEYTYGAASSELLLYAESSDATSRYYLDDITITADEDPGQSGLSTDFESGTAQGWTPRASAALAVTGETAHGGTRSLAVTGRSASWDGPSLKVLGRMNKGSKYALSVWVRLGPDVTSGDLGLSLERRTAGEPVYERVAAPKAITAGEWTRLTGTYTLAHDVDFLAVYVESGTGTFPFLLDDFALSYIEPKPIQTDIPDAADGLPFELGTAVERAATLGEHGELLLKHFSSMTPGNDLKWEATEPREGEFTFAEADHLVGFAEQHGLKFRGHTLAWHSQTPAWVFEGLEATPEDKALLLSRLEKHIRAVAGRYRGKIDAWDVVNEVIDENQPDGLRRSRWFEITGLDYIRTAFRVAREADPDAKLFINDYNTEYPRKREALHALVAKLRAEGVPIDGVGHQLHVNIEQAPAAEIEKTIERFADLGVDQHVTELDVSVYTDFVQSYPEISPELFNEQGHRYKELFDVFRRQSDRLSSVTVWGLADDGTWLSTFPITRLNPPLLFDDELQAKPAYWGVVDPAKLAPLVRELSAPEAGVRIDGKRELEWDLLPDTPIARQGELSAGFQARWSASGVAVLAEVRDPSYGKADTVTVRAGGTDYVVRRGGTHAGGFKAHVKKVDGGYRVEALLPVTLGEPVPWRVTVTSGGDEISWNGRLKAINRVKVASAPGGTPTLDGVEEAVWAAAPAITTATVIEGAPKAVAKVKALWSPGRLHVLAKVTDDDLSAESANAWEQDSVEFFVDPGNGKTKGYDDDDGQYRIGFTGRQTVGGTFDAFAIKDNLTSAARQVPGGYVIEATIALPTVRLARDALLGFDVQVNDATGPARTGAATWHDAGGRSYLSTAGWGVLRLTR